MVSSSDHQDGHQYGHQDFLMEGDHINHYEKYHHYHYELSHYELSHYGLFHYDHLVVTVEANYP